MTKNTYPCKCGFGTYTYISEMDDWSRTRVNYILDCKECIEKYVIDEDGYFISKAKLIITTKFKKQIDKYINELNQYIQDTYGEKWINLFSSCKTKKDYWNKLGEIKVELGEYPQSVGTFYKNVKYYGNVDNYLLHLFRSYSQYREKNMSLFNRLLKLMSINDEIIEEAKTRISKIEFEQETELKAVT